MYSCNLKKYLRKGDLISSYYPFNVSSILGDVSSPFFVLANCAFSLIFPLSFTGVFKFFINLLERLLIISIECLLSSIISSHIFIIFFYNFHRFSVLYFSSFFCDGITDWILLIHTLRGSL